MQGASAYFQGLSALFPFRGAAGPLSAFYENSSDPSREPLAEAEAIQGNYNGKGVLDEVDVKGVTWTRYAAETGTVYIYAKAPCGKTVHMFFDNGITWDDALPMMENVVLK